METEELNRGGVQKTWWDCVIGDMGSFGQSHEDALDLDEWRWRFRRETGEPGFTWKMASKMVCMRVCVKPAVCSVSHHLTLPPVARGGSWARE